MIFSSTPRRRLKLRSTPVPPAWREILQRRFPLFACLPPEDQQELERHIQVFLAEKQFEGCDGLVIAEEIRVVIAAQACLLLLHRNTDYYPDLKSILVYPSTYFSRVTEEDDEKSAGFAGQSWLRGPVILAWDAVQGGVSNRSDGQNVVFHEFAHQLDEEDGRVDGTPVLGTGCGLPERLSRYRSWARILSKEYEQLQQASGGGEETVLDEYGASNPAEFFAVATECFFEKPRPLRHKHPELYGELKRFYQQDPAEWPLQPPSTPRESSR
jgi:Mlc titration factor MtfA (ptsG expression regulator)